MCSDFIYNFCLNPSSTQKFGDILSYCEVGLLREGLQIFPSNELEFFSTDFNRSVQYRVSDRQDNRRAGRQADMTNLVVAFSQLC
jgi:hypothetical protein